MLENPKIIAFIPTVDPSRSKHFYQEIIGLSLVSEDAYALAFKKGETSLRIAVVEKFEPFAFTVLGFVINRIGQEVKSLIEKAVVFQKYASLEQDNLGIWTSPSKAKIAWFKDPDGNLISLTELPK